MQVFVVPFEKDTNALFFVKGKFVCFEPVVDNTQVILNAGYKQR